MPDTDTSTGALDFTASFPPDDRFASTAGELAARLATATGCAAATVGALRQAVDAAFHDAASMQGADAVELTLRVTDAAIEAGMSCGPRTLLRVSHARPA